MTHLLLDKSQSIIQNPKQLLFTIHWIESNANELHHRISSSILKFFKLPAKLVAADFACPCVNVFIKNVWKGGANDSKWAEKKINQSKNRFNQRFHCIEMLRNGSSATNSIVFGEVCDHRLESFSIDATKCVYVWRRFCCGCTYKQCIMRNITRTYIETCSHEENEQQPKGKRLKQQKGECDDDDGRCCLSVSMHVTCVCVCVFFFLL